MITLDAVLQSGGVVYDFRGNIKLPVGHEVLVRVTTKEEPVDMRLASTRDVVASVSMLSSEDEKIPASGSVNIIVKAESTGKSSLIFIGDNKTIVYEFDLIVFDPSISLGGNAQIVDETNQ
jgi:hypothetical protein